MQEDAGKRNAAEVVVIMRVAKHPLKYKNCLVFDNEMVFSVLNRYQIGLVQYILMWIYFLMQTHFCFHGVRTTVYVSAGNTIAQPTHNACTHWLCSLCGLGYESGWPVLFSYDLTTTTESGLWWSVKVGNTWVRACSHRYCQTRNEELDW